MPRTSSTSDVRNGLFPPWFVPMGVFKQFKRLLPGLHITKGSGYISTITVVSTANASRSCMAAAVSASLVCPLSIAGYGKWTKT